MSPFEKFNPKILILSNECLSLNSSNGRTMLKLLQGFEKESLAQFFIHGTPDMDICSNYFQVSDRDALNAFLLKKNTDKMESQSEKESGPKIVRNCKNLLLRDIVWMSMKWWNKSFDKFLDDFSPDVAILQAGDAPFMFAIARKISKQKQIPIIMYNSEHYVLKKRLYSGVKKNDFWHWLYRHRLKRQYHRFMGKVSYCVYSMKELETAYQQAYPHFGRSTSIYVSSDVEPVDMVQKNDKFTLLYCGNLGVGRSEAIADVAETLSQIDSETKFVIYGRFPSQEMQQTICQYPVVDFRGFVSYEEITGAMQKSDMILHCENNDRLQNLQYAFSTKIADCLSCGVPFLVYASKQFPFVKYLEENHAAHIAGDRIELKHILQNCIESKEYSVKYIKNGLNLAKKNHNTSDNSMLFKSIIDSII